MKKPEWYLAGSEPVPFNTYNDFVKPILLYDLHEKGLSSERIEYEARLLDARHHM